MPQADLSRWSLEEKAALLSGEDFQSTKALPEQGVSALQMCDGPYGVRFVPADELVSAESWMTAARPATCFPPPVAVGCSWDPAIAARLATALAIELRSFGVNISLAPAMNIKRSPLCGRNFEYYSEDPLLTGMLAAAYVRAAQAEGVGTSAKHFAANNQETARMQVSSDVDERTLREIYLAAFERVVKEAKPTTVMSSYNKVNGVYASQDPWLLQTVLRDEWGFGGVVVSDWGAVSDRVAALKAGLDLEMPGSGGVNDRELVEAVRAGELDEAVVDRSVLRLLQLSALASQPLTTFDPEAHHRLARELAAECAVLLKNDRETLPLDESARLAVIGVFAEQPRYQGGGSSHVNAFRVDSSLAAIEAHAAQRGQSVTFSPGFSIDGSGDEQEMRDDAVRAAESADIAVIFAGLAEADESEGFDRATIELPPGQIRLIRAVAATAARTVVVLSHGGVVSLSGWHDDVDAILDGFLLGQGGGSALADLLVGVANPSGHLPETIPLRLEDNPSYLNFPGELGHVRYGEGVMVGYRAYISADLPVRYPFGHGLSYTTFVTEDLSVNQTGPDSVDVSVTVANTGSRVGKHVVQVYVATNAGPVRRPTRELKAFAKLEIEPGMSATATFSLDRRAFAYYDIRYADWVIAGGDYRIQIGHDAAHIVAEQPVTLTGDQLVPRLTLDSPFEDWLAHPSLRDPVVELIASGLAHGEAGLSSELLGDPHVLSMVGSMPIRQLALFPGVDLPLAKLSSLLEQHA